jgi:hypothetical protein
VTTMKAKLTQIWALITVKWCEIIHPPTAYLRWGFYRIGYCPRCHGLRLRQTSLSLFEDAQGQNLTRLVTLLGISRKRRWIFFKETDHELRMRATKWHQSPYVRLGTRSRKQAVH